MPTVLGIAVTRAQGHLFAGDRSALCAAQVKAHSSQNTFPFPKKGF